MKNGEKYFVRIDSRREGTTPDEATLAQHMRYMKKLAAETTLIAGTFAEQPGGMVIFHARDRASADEACRNDPIIIAGYYNYALFEWTVLLT